jgi:hypothetical protein
MGVVLGAGNTVCLLYNSELNQGVTQWLSHILYISFEVNT